MVQRTQNDFPKVGAKKGLDETVGPNSGSMAGEPRGLLGKELPKYPSNGKAGTPITPAKAAKDPKISPKV